MNSRMHTITITFLLSTFSLNCFACDLSFDGTEFLTALYSKGIHPGKSCHEVDMKANKFFAFPNKSCEIILPQTGWLASGWRFGGIHGEGTFNVYKDKNSIKIEIFEGGGFRLKEVMLHSEQADCDTQATLVSIL